MPQEQFKKVIEKIKEHMKANGGEGGDVVVKVVPVDQLKQMKKEQAPQNVPPPPPAFAPKDK